MPSAYSDRLLVGKEQSNELDAALRNGAGSIVERLSITSALWTCYCPRDGIDRSNSIRKGDGNTLANHMHSAGLWPVPLVIAFMPEPSGSHVRSKVFRPIARRAFKKSRLGCNTCKARKVKCDEKHPVCGNCARRFLNLESCDYDAFITSSSSQNSQGISLQPPSIQIRSESNNTSIPRVLELRLLHHYMTITSAQMPLGESKIWNEDLPRLGFQSGQVLDAILGISAQHLWALLPRERSLAHASRYYLDRAIRQHKEALAHADRRSAEGLLAAAILITHHVWTAAHSECISGGDYSLPLQTYYMARGIMALSDQLFPWLKGSGYLWYVEQNIDIPSNEPRQGQYWRDGKLDLDIMTAHVERADLSPRDIDIYLSAIKDLESMHMAIKAGLPQPYLQRMVATMPVRLPIRFLKLVEEKKPLALALLARNLALLKVIDTIWWLHGAGGHQVVEPSVHGICKLLPTDWKWATEWPLKVISGEITIKD